LFIAPKNQWMARGDYSQIEARVLPWLSGEYSKVDAFKAYDRGEGPDIYIVTAAAMNRVPTSSIDKDDPRRQSGKVTDLACGFGGGKGALFAMAKIYGMKLTEEHAEQSVFQWREANPNTKQFWYDLENTAVRCMRDPPGPVFPAGKTGLISFKRNGTCLAMILPSGRRLIYWYARLEEVDTPWGVKKWAVTYYGEDSQRHVWRRFTAWYGIFAENCLGAETEVLTDAGWKPLIDVQVSDRVWDGEEWVNHEGVVSKGEQPVIDFGGVWVTPDHKVDIGLQWVVASATSSAEAARSFSQHYRLPLRPADGEIPARPSSDRRVCVGVPLRLREPEDHDLLAVQERGCQVLRMRNVGLEIGKRKATQDSRDVSASSVLRVAIYDRPLQVADASGVPQLRRPWHHGVRTVAEQLCRVLGRHGTHLRNRLNVGPGRQQQGIRQEQLPLGHSPHPGPEHAAERACGPSDWSRSRGCRSNQPDYGLLPDRTRVASRTSVGHAGLREPRSIAVYDILNAGPRHRFTVRGTDGRPFIVSNCTQAVARDVMAYSLVLLDKRGMKPVLTVHDEAVVQVLKRDYPLARFAAQAVLDVMLERPPWTPGLPIAAEASADNRYTKGSKENTVSGYTRN
jgi:hypothetical protein